MFLIHSYTHTHTHKARSFSFFLMSYHKQKISFPKSSFFVPFLSLVVQFCVLFKTILCSVPIPWYFWIRIEFPKMIHKKKQHKRRRLLDFQNKITTQPPSSNLPYCFSLLFNFPSFALFFSFDNLWVLILFFLLLVSYFLRSLFHDNK